MQREIKYRTWDEKAKTMFQVETLHLYMLAKRKRPLMQYMGLKDKNRKEIYEGDILRCIAKGGFEHKSTIHLGWSENDEYGWCWQSGAIVRKVDFISERYEVIGNIYENPDLVPSE